MLESSYWRWLGTHNTTKEESLNSAGFICVRVFEELCAEDSFSEAQVEADISMLNAIWQFYSIKSHPALPLQINCEGFPNM